eukprot:284817986_4
MSCQTPLPGSTKLQCYKLAFCYAGIVIHDRQRHCRVNSKLIRKFCVPAPNFLRSIRINRCDGSHYKCLVNQVRLRSSGARCWTKERKISFSLWIRPHAVIRSCCSSCCCCCCLLWVPVGLSASWSSRHRRDMMKHLLLVFLLHVHHQRLGIHCNHACRSHHIHRTRRQYCTSGCICGGCGSCGSGIIPCRSVRVITLSSSSPPFLSCARSCVSAPTAPRPVVRLLCPTPFWLSLTDIYLPTSDVVLLCSLPFPPCWTARQAGMSCQTPLPGSTKLQCYKLAFCYAGIVIHDRQRHCRVNSKLIRKFCVPAPNFLRSIRINRCDGSHYKCLVNQVRLRSSGARCWTKERKISFSLWIRPHAVIRSCCSSCCCCCCLLWVPVRLSASWSS